MSLLEIIKNDALVARKARDTVKASLLTTLYSESARIGKDAGNRETTDDEVTKVIRKFLKGIQETLATGRATGVDTLQLEQAILEAYLPQMASEADVRAYINTLVTGDVKPAIGIVMGSLRQKFGAALDGAVASKLVKEALA